MCREPGKGVLIFLSKSQAGPGKTVKQEQEDISRNHVQALFPGPVVVSMAKCGICFDNSRTNVENVAMAR